MYWLLFFFVFYSHWNYSLGGIVMQFSTTIHWCRFNSLASTNVIRIEAVNRYCGKMVCYFQTNSNRKNEMKQTNKKWRNCTTFDKLIWLNTLSFRALSLALFFSVCHSLIHLVRRAHFEPNQNTFAVIRFKVPGISFSISFFSVYCLAYLNVC